MSSDIWLKSLEIILGERKKFFIVWNISMWSRYLYSHLNKNSDMYKGVHLCPVHRAVEVGSPFMVSISSPFFPKMGLFSQIHYFRRGITCFGDLPPQSRSRVTQPQVVKLFFPFVVRNMWGEVEVIFPLFEIINMSGN